MITISALLAVVRSSGNVLPQAQVIALGTVSPISLYSTESESQLTPNGYNITCVTTNGLNPVPQFLGSDRSSALTSMFRAQLPTVGSDADSIVGTEGNKDCADTADFMAFVYGLRRILRQRGANGTDVDAIMSHGTGVVWNVANACPTAVDASEKFETCIDRTFM